MANTSWYLYNFRLSHARRLRELGYMPVFVSPRDEFTGKLASQGFEWVELGLNRRSMNPIAELGVLVRLVRIYFKHKPSLVHHFTIKCVLYGTIAARVSGARRIVNSVTGLGHVFLDQRPVVRIVRPFVMRLYRAVLNSERVTTIFQNGDDMDFFVKSRIVRPEKACLIRSSGVNTEHFKPEPRRETAGRPVVLFASRLLREKGVLEFMSAARSLGNSNIRFVIAGQPDHGNPSSFTDAEIQLFKSEGVAEFAGHVANMKELILDSTIVVLPSYREGVPKILIEALAMERPVIATDVPGCREAVEHMKNGMLVPVRSAVALADAIVALLKNEKMMREFGRYGREKAIRDFSEAKVIASTFDVYGIGRGGE